MNKEGGDANADVTATEGQRKDCVQECQCEGLYRFEDKRDEFMRTKLWPRWVLENRSLHKNWSKVLDQMRNQSAPVTSATSSAVLSDVSIACLLFHDNSFCCP